MQETSSLYESIFSGIHRFEVKVNIAGTEYGMNVITSMRSNIAAFGDDGPTLGLAVASDLSLNLYADTADVPRMAAIRPYYRVVNDSRQSEWISMGVFYVDTREYEQISGLLHLTAFDPMLKAEALYPSSTLQWPATDIDVVREIAGFVGFSVDSRTTALMTAGFSVPLAPQMTMREMLQYIAAMYGGSFIITEQGTLLLVVLWGQKTTADLDAGSGTSLMAGPAFPACTGVRFIVNSTATEVTEVFAGDETGYVYEIECPFATQPVANWLLAKLNGFVYRPFSVEKSATDPAFEIGDTISVPDGLGSTFLSCVWSRELNFNSGCRPTINAPGELEIDHEYSHESATVRMFKRQQRNTQAQITLLDDRITLAVESIEYTITESDNLISFPLKADTPNSFTTHGVTFTFQKDGSVLMTGTYTGGLYAEVYFTGSSHVTTGMIHNVSIKVPLDFPGSSSSSSPFYTSYATNGNSGYSANLNRAVSEDGGRTFYLDFNGSCNDFSIGVMLQDGATYNHVIYPQIAEVSGLYDVPPAWQQPIGSTYSVVDNKVDKGTVSSEISLEPGQINIRGNRIAIDSSNFKVTNDGTITANAGHIGGWEIESDKLKKEDDSWGVLLDPINAYFNTHLSGCGVAVGRFPIGSDRYNYGIDFYYATDGERDSSIAQIIPETTDGSLTVKLESNSELHVKKDGSYIFYVGEDGNYQYYTVSGNRYSSSGSLAGITADYIDLAGIVHVGDSLEVMGDCIFTGDVMCFDRLECNILYARGSKNRIIRTKNHGTRCISAYETAAPYFGDIGQAVVDEHGVCVVPIEEIFSEMVDLDTEYQVFLQKEGPGDIWVDEKAKDHFTVKGTPGLKFAWELKAKQIDHDGKRLEEYEEKKTGGK